MSTSEGLNGWYELFSRGARDWLRHSDKVREAVRNHLPQIVAGADSIHDGARTVRVPVRMLEHYRFRLRDAEQSGEGVGQGNVKPGTTLGPAQPQSGPGQKGAGSTEGGGIELMLEFKIDDIIDWLWEDLRLPNLQARVGPSEEAEWKREGWDRRGARSRLDRRRSLKEAVKRRAMDPSQPGFTDEDLRFRQLTRRRQPAIRAVVFLLLDVSGSMTERDRQLAKTFFFWVVAGLRREYRYLDTVFVAHTTEAFEFNEADFFQVSGSGGTVTSTGVAKVREIAEQRFNPANCNVYLFYASDGDNASDDRAAAHTELTALGKLARYCGYLEIAANGARGTPTEVYRLFEQLGSAGLPSGQFIVSQPDDIFSAVRHFFSVEAQAAAAAAEPQGAAP
jgi:uncharacterized sporulation protein YeaH/YhbH (DUF444 family)